MRLNNKIALITGSARGIGQATAELFQKEGAIVLISDIRDTEGQRLQNQLGKGTELTIDGGILAGSEARPG